MHITGIKQHMRTSAEAENKKRQGQGQDEILFRLDPAWNRCPQDTVLSRGIITKILVLGPEMGREVQEGASASSGRAGTIGLMLISMKTGDVKEGVWHSGGAKLPQAPPHGDAPGFVQNNK